MGVFVVSIVLFFLTLLSKAVVYWPPNDDLVKELKGFDLNYTYPWMYSGFVGVEKETDSNLFYWFFREENGNTKAPLVIWINGGPGSSSMLGNLQENGPLKLLKDRESGNVNVHSLKGEAWSAVSNIVFVDQPIGVGYSYGHRKVEDGKQVGEYMVKFIQGFYKKFPDMKENKFFISGESYGGKYLPAIATAIIDYNKNASSSENKIQLNGVLIGNGFTNPIPQFMTTRHFPLSLGHFQFDSLPELDTIEKRCLTLNGMHANYAYEYWFNISTFITSMNGGMNIYDARYSITNFTEGNDILNEYLNDPTVVNQLHCDKSHKEVKFVSSNSTVYNNINNDKMVRYVDQHQTILDNNITLCIYAGSFDSIVSPYGIQEWMKDLKWNEMNNFYKSSRNLYYYASDDNGKVKLGGNFKQHKNLSVLIVYAAGHLVPSTQLALSRNMLSDIIYNNTLLWHQTEGKCSLDIKTWNFMNNCTNHGECNQGKCACSSGYYGADWSITVDTLGSNSFTLNATSWRYFKVDSSDNVRLQVEGSNNTLVYTRKGDIPSQSFYNTYSHGTKIIININKNITGEFVAIFNPNQDNALSMYI